MPSQPAAMEHKELVVHFISMDDATGVVESIVSVMGVRDMMDDIIHPGAYTKTIFERTGKIRVLDNHRTNSTDSALGRPLELRELSREELPPEILRDFPEATGGLYAKTQFDLDTDEGLGAFKRLKNGSLNEWSIGFDVIRWDKSTVTNAEGKKILVRNIREIRLWEYSVVLWGANQATYTGDIRNAPINSEETMPNANNTKGQSDAPNYQSAPAGHDRCSTCAFFDPTGECTKFAFKADPDYLCSDYKAGNQKNSPNGRKAVEGIPTTIGSKLIARVYDTYISIISSWLHCSNITVEEHRSLVEKGTELLDMLTTAIPAEIADRELMSDPYFDMLFWAHEGAEQIKRLQVRSTKSGRVLSAANATKLVSAVEQIQTVLTDAGIYDDVEEEKSNGKGSEAEPEIPLTDSNPNKDDVMAQFRAIKAEFEKLKGVQ